MKPGIKDLPAVKWKLMNTIRMGKRGINTEILLEAISKI